MNREGAELKKLADLYATYSTDELLLAVTNHASRYTPEALSLMQAEIQKRDGKQNIHQHGAGLQYGPEDIGPFKQVSNHPPPLPLKRRKDDLISGIAIICLYGFTGFNAVFMLVCVMARALVSSADSRSLSIMAAGPIICMALTCIGILFLRIRWWFILGTVPIILANILFLEVTKSLR
jgi:hypothetical protein